MRVLPYGQRQERSGLDPVLSPVGHRNARYQVTRESPDCQVRAKEERPYCPYNRRQTKSWENSDAHKILSRICVDSERRDCNSRVCTVALRFRLDLCQRNPPLRRTALATILSNLVSLPASTGPPATRTVRISVDCADDVAALPVGVL